MVVYKLYLTFDHKFSRHGLKTNQTAWKVSHESNLTNNNLLLKTGRSCFKTR